MTKRNRRILYLFFVVMFVISLLYFTSDITDYYKVKIQYSKIQTKVKNDSSIDWNALLKINPDIAAWIEIPDTDINYPVVMAKDNETYLNKDIRQNDSRYGAIFLDCRLFGTKISENPNNIIYGHNMGRWTDAMFGTLKEYLNAGYLKNHEEVILYTKDKTFYYRIASVMRVDENSTVYKTDFKDTEYSGWIEKQTECSIYQCLADKAVQSFTCNFKNGKLKNNVKKYGNTLTLSTCDTTHNNDKKIVVFCINEEKINCDFQS